MTPDRASAPRRWARISRTEWWCVALVACGLAVLVAAEPRIVTAAFESARAIAFVVIGTVVAAIAYVVMLRFRVRPIVRILVLGIPFLATSFWLISPHFRDTVVQDDFAVSIAAAPRATSTSTTLPGVPFTEGAAPIPPTVAPPTSPPVPTLLGTGMFTGLAGHRGTGDGAIFRVADGSSVLRLEHLDIDNGPDLELYLVPGADRRSPIDGAHHFGQLRGNVGNQTYEIPSGYAVTPGPWTVLVWCEAFSVEFVAATLHVA